MSRLVIKNGKLILPDRILAGNVVCENGKISAILPEDAPVVPEEGDEVIDAEGKYVSPGFVDIHVHGGGGYDFMDGNVEAILGAAEIHAQHGTTSIFPTTMTSSLEGMYKTFDSYKEAKKVNEKGARLMGLHLEGPYFSRSKAGAQDPKFITPPIEKDYKAMLAYTDDIARWDAAPELEGAMEFGDYLSKKGVVVAVAHTDATTEQAMEAHEHGYTLMTHFYCAMSTVHKEGIFRHSGCVEAGYLIDDYDVEIIADGIHLPENVLKLVYKFKGADKVALITDALRPAGLPDGYYTLGSLGEGQKIVKEGGVGKLADRSALAGSVSTTDVLVRNMMKIAEVPVVDAVKMMSLTPARIMKVNDKIGSLETGKYADILLFDDDVNISKVIIGGKVIY